MARSGVGLLAIAGLLAGCWPDANLDGQYTCDDGVCPSDMRCQDKVCVTTSGATRLGKRCSTNADCPTQAPDCITLDGTNRFCSLECGKSNDPSMPPADGQATCAAQYDGSSGTASCSMNNATGDPAACPFLVGCVWHCAIDCTGACPNMLACTQGRCGG